MTELGHAPQKISIALASRFLTPIGRLMMAAIFLISGVGKLGAYAATQGYMQSMGVPAALLPLVIAVEIGGALSIIAGAYSRTAALLLAGFTLISALIFHANFADQIQQVMFLKNVSIAGGLLMLAAQGPGMFSVNDR